MAARFAPTQTNVKANVLSKRAFPQAARQPEYVVHLRSSWAVMAMSKMEKFNRPVPMVNITNPQPYEKVDNLGNVAPYSPRLIPATLPLFYNSHPLNITASHQRQVQLLAAPDNYHRCVIVHLDLRPIQQLALLPAKYL